MVRYRTHYDVLELCNRAGSMLKRAGFVHQNTSMKTEAAYYRWPDRTELIRVATHGKRHARMPERYGTVITSITFRGTHADPPGMMNISEDKIELMVAVAIGRYFLKTAPQQGDMYEMADLVSDAFASNGWRGELTSAIVAAMYWAKENEPVDN